MSYAGVTARANSVGYLQVLTLIPESWSLEQLSNFLESALRQLVTERNETVITKALTSVQNLIISANLIEKIDAFGPKVE